MKTIAASVGKYTSLVIASIVMLLPIALIITGSFKTNQEFLSTGAFTAPENWFNFSNYASAFSRGGMLLGFANTAIILVVAIVGTILIGAAAAYALDRFEFRIRGLVMGLFLLATLVPGVTTQVATFQIIKALGLYNTHGALILLFMGTDIVSIYIFIQFMRSIPKSLDEAAKLDGAGHLRIFFQVILPNLKLGLASTALLGFALSWEEVAVTLFITSVNVDTLPKRIWSGLRDNVDPSVAAISVLLAIQISYTTAAAIGMEPAARQFSAVPFTGILLFAILFTLAIRNVRKPDVHRRYMYATLVPLLQAAVARWFQVALSPPGAVGPPPVFVAIPPGLVVSALFFIPLVLHDRRAFGHVHRASWIVIAATLLVQLSPLVLAPTGLWAAFTSAFASLAPHR